MVLITRYALYILKIQIWRHLYSKCLPLSKMSAVVLKYAKCYQPVCVLRHRHNCLCWMLGVEVLWVSRSAHVSVFSMVPHLMIWGLCWHFCVICKFILYHRTNMNIEYIKFVGGESTCPGGHVAIFTYSACGSVIRSRHKKCLFRFKWFTNIRTNLYVANTNRPFLVPVHCF